MITYLIPRRKDSEVTKSRLYKVLQTMTQQMIMMEKDLELKNSRLIHHVLAPKLRGKGLKITKLCLYKIRQMVAHLNSREKDLEEKRSPLYKHILRLKLMS